MTPISANIPPTGASAAILQPSEPISECAVSVQGPNFDEPLSLQDFLKSYERIGFQANSLGQAIDIVNRMVGSWNLNASWTIAKLTFSA
jgi:deoxyhypusine synthase